MEYPITNQSLLKSIDLAMEQEYKAGRRPNVVIYNWFWRPIQGELATAGKILTPFGDLDAHPTNLCDFYTLYLELQDAS